MIVDNARNKGINERAVGIAVSALVDRYGERIREQVNEELYKTVKSCRNPDFV